MVAELYVGHGAVRWQDKNQQEPLRIMAPARVVLGGPAPPEAQPLENKDLPKWIEPEPLRDLDQRGRIVLAQSLQVGRPAESGLKELAGHRRSEVARFGAALPRLPRRFRARGRGAERCGPTAILV